MSDTIQKITVGFVTQTIDVETGKVISQEFICGDDVSYEDDMGNPVDEPDNEELCPIKLERPGGYGRISWCAEDILTLRPSWTKEQADDFLDENESYLCDGTITHGWAVIESLLPPRTEADDKADEEG